MNRNQIRLTIVFNACVALALASANASAQGYPAECKPVGAASCATVRPSDLEYYAQLCEDARYFPSENQAAEHTFTNWFGTHPGCPAPTKLALGWADDDIGVCGGFSNCTPPDVTFTRLCPGESHGPYPITEAGNEVVTYSLYRVTTYVTPPSCTAQVHDRPPLGDVLAPGLVRATRSIECPDGYTKEGTGDDQFCKRNDEDFDAGKNLGCPKKALGQCSDGNPINIGTGNKYQVETDYSGAGPNPLRFQRIYNSFAALSRSPNGLHRFATTNSARPIAAFLDPNQSSSGKAMALDSIGANWRHTYQRGVVETSTPALRSVALYRHDGAVLVFNEYNGSWVADADVNYTVTKLPNATATAAWEVRTPSDSIETYNGLGQLVSIANRAGVTTTVHYDDIGRIDRVTDQFGRELDFAYAAEPQPGVAWWEDPSLVNQIESITDPAGNTYTYGYGAGGKLTSVTYPDTNVREYRYDNATFPFALTAIIDGNLEQFATFAYDSDGRARLSYHGQGPEIAERVDVAYTKTSSFAQYFSVASAAVTFGDGSPTSYSKTTQVGRRLGVAKMNSMTQGGTSEARTYDARGNVERHTDLNGNTTYRTYNSRNLETLRREAENDPLERQVTTTWHPTYRLRDVITEPNRTIDYDYYANGDVQQVTITSLNSSGSEDLSTDGNRTRIWNYQYNAHGQATSIDGPRVDVTDVTTLDYYDDPACPAGNGECGQLEFVIDAEGNRTDFDEYYADGRLKKMTDPNGLVTQYEYDARRRLTRVTLTDGSTSRVTQYSYDNAGQVDRVTYPNGLVLDFEWTSAHLLDYVEDNLGNRIDYAYDAHGNRTVENRLDPAGVIRNALATSYDDFGFVDTVTSGTLAAGNAITTDFDYDPLGNLDSVTDANASVTDYFVDALGRAHRVTDALANDTDYGFDSQDNVTLVTAPNGATTSLPHDGLGNLDQELSPDRGAIDLDYDDAGNLRVKLDARGLETQYAYDALNRVTTITLDGGATIDYSYDDAATNGRGRLRRITDPSGETSWSYNAYGEVISTTRTIGTVTLTTDYQYHPNGQLEWLRLPSGRTVYYGYTGHLPASVTVDTETVLQSVAYEPFGPVKSWAWGNGTSSSRSYDTRGLLTSQSLASYTRTLGYDAVGNLNSVDDGRPPGQIDYTELVPQAGNFDYTLVAFSNRVDSVAGPVAKSYVYDAAGNTTSDGSHSYGYDDRGRLTSVDAGATASYQHNGSGQRVRKDAGSSTTLFVYDEAGQLLGEYDAAGTPIREHVWFEGAPVAVLSGTDVYYVHTDHLGTPRAITEGTTEIWRWASTPFGWNQADEDPDGNGTSFTYNLRFPGQYYDEETGLHYNYFRTYDPSTGRYLESDPIGLNGGLNTFAYVNGNPLSFSDPQGLQPVCFAWPVGTAACAGAAAVAGYRAYRAYRAAMAIDAAIEDAMAATQSDDDACEDDAEDDYLKDCADQLEAEQDDCYDTYGELIGPERDQIISACLARASARFSYCTSNKGDMSDAPGPFTDADWEGYPTIRELRKKSKR